ncbi:hypothetical protein AU187_24490 [Mycobacterium sp. IS-1556]|nr:hypothetical protein AU187_24490 [Mycobacterium sp. IS-1556]
MTPEAIALLARILHGVPVLPGALCPDHPHVFYTSSDTTDPETRDYAATTAIRLCKACPALEACRDWLDSLPAAERPLGVVAGRISTPQPN